MTENRWRFQSCLLPGTRGNYQIILLLKCWRKWKWTLHHPPYQRMGLSRERERCARRILRMRKTSTYLEILLQEETQTTSSKRMMKGDFLVEDWPQNKKPFWIFSIAPAKKAYRKMWAIAFWSVILLLFADLRQWHEKLEELSITSIRRLLNHLDRTAKKNQDLRSKYPDDPTK